MEVFDPSTEITPSSLRQDRITLLVGDWQIEGQQTNIRGFFNRICSSGGRSNIPQDELGWIFLRPEGGINDAYKFLIRTNTSSTAGSPPLFSGHLRVITRSVSNRASARGIIRKALQVSLNINPTRFAFYQSAQANSHDDPNNWSPSLNMRRRRLIELREDSELRVRVRYRRDTLDGADNLITARHAEVFDDESWNVLLSAYINEVIEVINNEFLRAAALSDVEFDFNTVRRQRQLRRMLPLFTLTECETYAEFQPPEGRNGIELVDNLFTYLTQYRRHRVDEYDVNSNSSESLEAAKSITLWIANGVKLKIYAKTLRRVRFEIRFSLSDCSNLLHEDESSRRTTQEEEELIFWILYLNQHAARFLQNLFSFLEARMNMDEYSIPYLLPLRIGQSIPHASIADGILSSLIRNGSITLRRTRDRYRRWISLLVDEGILQPVEGNRNSCLTYTVTPEYQTSLASYRGQRD